MSDLIIPSEFEDYKDLLALAAKKKYPANNWLQDNGLKSSFIQMHDSMFHHLAESLAGRRMDPESGMDPLLHLILRANMCYTRIQRGIRHGDD